MLGQLGLIIQAFLGALPLKRILEGFFVFFLVKESVRGGFLFGGNPNLTRFFGRLFLKDPDLVLLPLDGLLDRDEGEQKRAEQSGDGFKAKEIEDKSIINRGILNEDVSQTPVGIRDGFLNRVHDAVGRRRRIDIARLAEREIEDAGRDAHRRGRDDAEDTHRAAIDPETVLPFFVIENISQQGHEDIGTGQAAEVLDELPSQNHIEVRRGEPADATAERIEQEAIERDVPLPHLLGERPNEEDANAHRQTANHRDQHLGGAIGVGA